MLELRDLQRGFEAAMRLEGDQAISGAIHTAGPLDNTHRLDIYRNNIAAALGRALEDLYPATKRLVGDRPFKALARRYTHFHPPVHGVLMHYGTKFPDFLQGVEGLEMTPYLPDVARLELAWHRAYTAADADPVDAGRFAELAPETMSDLRMDLHPSAQLIRSSYPAIRVWEIASAEDEPHDTIDINIGPQQALVIRPRSQVEVRTLKPDAFCFLESLANGDALMDAAAVAQDVNAEFDLQGHLTSFFVDGTFTDFHICDGID